MSFNDDIKAFQALTAARTRAVFVGTVDEMRDSIKFGSTLTGAPAMPVAPVAEARAGALRDSVTSEYPDANTAIISTTEDYALDVEDNPRGHRFHSGGPHGWKLTAAAFPRVVAHQVQLAGGEA